MAGDEEKKSFCSCINAAFIYLFGGNVDTDDDSAGAISAPRSKNGASSIASSDYGCDVEEADVAVELSATPDTVDESVAKGIETK